MIGTDQQKEGSSGTQRRTTMAYPLGSDNSMNSRQYCVYNQTRECFLSLGVDAATTTFARLKGLIGKITLKSDEGLWIVPSSGVHTMGVLFPLDLIYLDEHYRVLHLVESFPTFRIAPLMRQASSVLQLPTHSIFSSQTQPGDQLVICVAEDMEQQLTLTRSICGTSSRS